VYSHEARIVEPPILPQQAPDFIPQTTTLAEHERSDREGSLTTCEQAYEEDEDDEDHISVEELDVFEQERNGSTESLIEALDEMFATDHALDYEN
jgi:hypothetical protein